jgi:large subunit ribosomal protein L22
VAREVKGSPAALAANQLRFHPSKGAKALHKVLVSAMANAQENHGLSPDQLRISTIAVDEGPRLKRMQARAMGRGNRIIKKTSHITVVVEDFEAQGAVKPHGTKAKARPSFAAPKKGKKSETAPVETVEAVDAEEAVMDATPAEQPTAEPEVTEEVVAEDATPEVQPEEENK